MKCIYEMLSSFTVQIIIVVHNSIDASSRNLDEEGFSSTVNLLKNQSAWIWSFQRLVHLQPFRQLLLVVRSKTEMTHVSTPSCHL